MSERSHYDKTNSRTRILALFLAVLTLFSILPMTASASTIADGSKTCTIALAERHYYLTTTAGTRLGASAYQYTTNDGITGPAYCIDHGLKYSSHALEIRGAYTASVATAAAFATGYPQHSLATFLGRYPNDTMLDGLTEDEYGYATQLAVWATLGQLAIEGTSFTSGRETVSEPTGDAQKARIFHAIQLILSTAKTWDRIYQTGMYIRLEENALGGNISIPGDMTLEFAADRERYGIKREVIGGKSYYTREYIFASATSTYYSNYSIELWADNAPEGTMFVDAENKELTRGNFRDTATWTLPSTYAYTKLNDNGYEYVGKAKLCIPVDTAPNKGEITVRCGAYVMQYQVYLAYNKTSTEQSYIISDPSKGTQTANAILKWGSEVTEKGSLQITKVGGGSQPLASAKFTLTGSDGSSRTGVTNDKGIIFWERLEPNIKYILSEDEAPAGYAIVDPVDVTIQAARTNYVTVKDSTQKQLTVRKIDAQTGYSLRGATIAFEQIDGSFRTTAVTDHAGIIQFNADSLPIGSYRVYEDSAPEGYEKDKTVQTVNWDGKSDVTLTFKDVRKPTLEIYKCDTDNLRSLPSASFEVYKDGQLITTVTTNDNGLAYVPGVTKGYYTVKETVAPAGYVLDSSEHSVYVDTYDPATKSDPRIVIKNSAKPQLRILKYDAQTGKPLSDTTFEVYRDAALLGQYTTDARFVP